MAEALSGRAESVSAEKARPGSFGASTESEALCPSAPPKVGEGFAFGVVGGPGEQPHVAYLTEPVVVTEGLLAATSPARPTEVLRFAAPCAGAACGHFDGEDCTLATRIVKVLPLAVARIPACVIRPNCRWWRQEGKDACLRCPGIVTESPGGSEAYRLAADPRELWSSTRENDG